MGKFLLIWWDLQSIIFASYSTTPVLPILQDFSRYVYMRKLPNNYLQCQLIVYNFVTGVTVFRKMRELNFNTKSDLQFLNIRLLMTSLVQIPDI